MFTVGQMARICSVSPKTLRHYEAIGLFHPASVDGETQYRYYSADQILPLRRIVGLRDLGLGLEMIRVLIQSGAIEDPERLTRILTERAEGLRREIAEREATLHRIANLVDELADGSGPIPLTSQPVTVKDLEGMQVVGLRRAIRVSEIPVLMDEVRHRLPARPAGPAICLYHNPEFDPEQVDVEAVIPVAEGGAQWLPPVRVATLIHQEPDHDVGTSYELLWRWVEQNGYRVVGLPREVYLGQPGGPLIIEIQYPIEAKEETS